MRSRGMAQRRFLCLLPWRYLAVGYKIPLAMGTGALKPGVVHRAPAHLGGPARNGIPCDPPHGGLGG